MFYEHRPYQGRWNHPIPAAMDWSRLLLHDVICSECVPFRRCRGVIGVHSVFLSLVTFDLWPWHYLTCPSEDQTCLPCEFGAKPFSRSRDIWFTTKKQTKKSDSAKKRTLRSLLCVVKKINTTKNFNAGTITAIQGRIMVPPGKWSE